MILIMQSEGDIITMRSPNFGDSYKLHLNVKTRYSMSAELWSWATPLDTILQTLNFSNLSRDKVNELAQFLENTSAKTINLQKQTDTGQVLESWIGKIMTNPLNSSHQGRSKSDLSLQFEGKRNA